ncbi:MAG: 8-amino-7-oxononanoate synthase [bacterium]
MILKTNKILRKLNECEKGSERYILIQGKKLLNFGSNNYLGLSNHPALKKAAQKAIDQYGISSCSSRLLSGNIHLYRILEEKIKELKKTEAALVFNSGYLTNLGIISNLAKEYNIIFCDKYNHASIIDGILLSKTPFKRYPHKNTIALEKSLKENDKQNKMLITDAVFSMNGNIAPLNSLVEISQKNKCFLIIDDAHGTGVLGKNGTGTLEHLGISSKKIDLQIGTFSKALGGFGGFAAGSKDLIEHLINTCRSFIYTTSLPPAILASNIKSIEILEKEPERREKLWENTYYFQKELLNLEFDIMQTETPIVPILLKDDEISLNFSKKLFEQNIFIPAIRPPSVPIKKSQLRISLSSLHSKKDLDYVLEQMKKIKNKLKIN